MRLHRQIKISSSVGLEITAAVARAVEVKWHGREIVVERLGATEIPEGCVRDGRVAEPMALSAALRRLWEKHGFSTRRCSLAVPVASLTPQMLTVPPAPVAEQRLIIQGELARFAPDRGRDALAWTPMAAGGGASGNTLVFLADGAAIASYAQALSMAGLELAISEPDATAALRTLHLGLSCSGAAAVIYVTSTCSEIAFLEGDRIRYYRRLDMGLDGLSQPTGAAAPGSMLKEEDELIRFLAGQQAGTPSGSPSEETLSALALEVRRSVHYYARAYADAPQPQRLIIVGDAPSLEPLAAVVQETVSLSTEAIDPLHLYPHAPEVTDRSILTAGGQYTVALGMALRPLDELGAEGSLDLRVPEENRTLAYQAPRYLMASLAGSTAVLLAALTVSLPLGARLGGLQDQLKSAGVELRVADTQRSMLIARLQQACTEGEQLRRQALPIAPVLTRLANLVPEELTLTNLQLDEEGTLTLDGEAGSPRQVNGFLQLLADDSRFRAPSLVSLDAATPASLMPGTSHFKVETGLAGYGQGMSKPGAEGGV